MPGVDVIADIRTYVGVSAEHAQCIMLSTEHAQCRRPLLSMLSTSFYLLSVPSDLL